MRYLRKEYRTKGFIHTQITRHEDIYLYDKVDIISGQLVCFEVFKAKKRYPHSKDIVGCKLGDHRPPIDEDFGYSAFSIIDEIKAYLKFDEIKKKHYG